MVNTSDRRRLPRRCYRRSATVATTDPRALAALRLGRGARRVLDGLHPVKWTTTHALAARLALNRRTVENAIGELRRHDQIEDRDCDNQASAGGAPLPDTSTEGVWLPMVVWVPTNLATTQPHEVLERIARLFE